MNYKDEMVRCIIQELVGRKQSLEGDQVETLYFGGGTPSLLDHKHLRSIVEAANDHYSFKNDIEFTLETNPDDINSNELDFWKTIGVNRLSIGTQSFSQKDLDWMNRAHTNIESIDSILLAKKFGFNNISIDLIYGLPEQSLENWNEQLDQALALDIQHLSCYCLTVEDRTALKKWVDTGKLSIPGDELQRKHFKLMREVLQKHGFEHYEISNFAKSGYRSRHNSSYWHADKYLGIGPSAHSFDGATRRWNISNNQLYMKLVESGDVFHESETLSAIDRFNEMILTGLRTSNGVNLEELNRVYQLPLVFMEQVKEAELKSWLNTVDNRIILTEDGWLVSDHIASLLFLEK